jgi:DNA polymerase beta
MNEKLVLCFKTLADQEKLATSPNIFRIRSYLKVAKIFSELKFEVKSSEQVKDISGIGAKTILKIDEILESGRLEKIESFQPILSTQKKDKKILEGITGVGPVKADKLIKDGYNLDKLKNIFKTNQNDLESVLTHHQILGVKYYDDLLQRIPYAEITLVDQYLKKNLETINLKKFKSGQFKMHICGSYRRMTPNSGDIDILFYNTSNTNDEETDVKFFKLFLSTLGTKGFLKDHLTDPEKVSTKYMGFCKLSRKKLCRRIDMRCIRYSSLASAMLYFTGSGDFNKNMRTFALKKGFTINEYGIYKLKSDKTKGEAVDVNSESDIFKTLGLDYIEPKDRLSTVNFK